MIKSLKKIKKLDKPEPKVVRGRWTILGVEEEAIDLVKQYSEDSKLSVGKALSRIIKEALNG